MNFLKFSILCSVAYLHIFFIKADNYSREAGITLNSNKRRVARVLIQQAKIFLTVIREKEEEFAQQLEEIPEASYFIKDKLEKAKSVISHLLRKLHIAENEPDFKDSSIHWHEANKPLSNSQWEPFRQFLHKLAIISNMIGRAQKHFEKQITTFTRRRKRSILERLETLLLLQRAMFQANWYLKKIFREYGFDRKKLNWINNRTKPLFAK